MSTNLGPESPFGFDELFFSRTDHKGIIQSGNSVFQRVSRFPWPELVGRPHNIIRHPRMPRGVFQLLWDTILQGSPVGAYVVNRAMDGSHYWVFALVLPVDGGFVSIRLKPGSAVFAVVKAKYEELLQAEKSQKLPTKESKELLLAEIQGLAFQNYQEFMTAALMQELENRQARLNVPANPALVQLTKMLELIERLEKSARAISAAYDKTSLVPLNLEVHAARIGEEAAAISTISGKYESLAREIQQEIASFSQASKVVQSRVRECQFNVCASLLQKEMLTFFRDETGDSPIRKELEISHLESLTRTGIEGSLASLRQVDREYERFTAAFDEVRKLSLALEIVSISGKIEAAKLNQGAEELLGLLGDLAAFKNSLKESLKEIEGIGRSLIGEAQVMKTQLLSDKSKAGMRSP